MERFSMKSLANWSNSPRRKPLILNGARQVGKTWLLREFGRLYFDNVAYINLDTDEIARTIFEQNLDPHRIVNELSLLTNQRIDPASTLVIIDEIQAQPKAITSLKYFCENAPEYTVATAGSLLGLSTHFGSGYPVGKVDTLNLYPMNFLEFLEATDNSAMRNLVESGETELLSTFLPRLETLLKQYYVVGGMPAAVDEFCSEGDLDTVRGLQEEIIEGYKRDFAKHAPQRLYPRMLETWDSIPQHLSRENKKFVFGNVRKGSRAKDFEEALTWLTQAGLIERVSRVSKPGIPLSAYNDNRSFKIFLLDVGLLGAMSGLYPRSILDGNAVFTEFKGTLTEQYVCQQLVSECECVPYYWSAENSRGEIDFLIQDKSRLFAIEVKAEENLQAKSLRAFKEKHPNVKALRFSMSEYREQDWMRNIPLFAISNKNLWAD